MALNVMSSNLQLSRILKELSYLNEYEDILVSHIQRPFGWQIIIKVFDVGFRLNLPEDYPFRAPTLECTSVLAFPSISDGRNLIENALKTSWMPSTSLYEIVSQLPVFVKCHRLNENIGSFQLFSLLDFSDWHNRADMGVFYCQELDKEYRKIEERVCLVTHSYFLLLQIDPHMTDVGYLIYIQHFSSISSLKLRTSNKEIIAISSKSNKGRYVLLKLARSQELLKLLTQNLNVLRNILCNFLSGEDSKLLYVNIYLLITRSEELYKRLKTNPTPQIIKETTKVYQAIIEYFSALGDPRFKIYLEKSQEVFQGL